MLTGKRIEGKFEMAFLTYGDDVRLDTATIPETSVHALLQRAFSHIMGNEAAAAHPKGEDGFEASRATWRTNKIAQIVAGTLGVRVGGPRVDPTEAEYRKLRLAYIKELVRKAGVKWPSKPKDAADGWEPTFTFPGGKVRTASQMFATVDAGNKGTELRKAAERNVAAAARATKSNGATGVDFDPDAIGA